jgi:hypothetical protein
MEKNEIGSAYNMYGDRRCVSRVVVGKPEGKELLEDPVVDGKIILRLIFRNWYMKTWTGSIWLRTRTDGGHL